MVAHPHSGEPIWFNDATFFHVTTLPPSIRDGIVAQFKEDEYTNNTYYGDGSPIEPEVLELLREYYRQAMKIFTWQQGDILAADNLLMLHAREPFSGSRKILVGIADPTSLRDVQL
jgi:alpha-ketoglutarate-dependent taurine dioxygenase